MEVSDARRLQAFDEENRRLKKLLAEVMLDVWTLREALGKTFDAWRAENGRDLGDRRERLLAAACCVLVGLERDSAAEALAAERRRFGDRRLHTCFGARAWLSVTRSSSDFTARRI